MDDVRIAVRPAPEGETPDSLLLSESWMPTLPGRHVVIVRATAANGVQGQATVIVEVQENAGTTTGLYPVEEGDTLASIAEAVGSTPEELAGLNPELEGGEPNPGDDLVIPGADDSGEDTDRDGTEGEEPEPGGEGDDIAPGGGGEDEDTSPDPEDDPPGDEDPFAEMREVFPDMGGDEAVYTGEPTAVRFEVLELSSHTPAMSLYCYLSLAGQPPVRVPDEDGDPSTDESFIPLENRFWNTAAHLGGMHGPVVYLPEDQMLTISMTCVGIAAGGMDAIDLGTVNFSTASGGWDGGQSFISSYGGADGTFIILIRISRVNDMRGVPLYLDADMTPPTSVTLNVMANTLSWEYAPRPDEESITGFRIYLNGALQWVETSGQRESRLPPEWFNPPCGSTYTFAVTAYRFELPDGPESPPAVDSITSPPEGEGCQRQVEINFLTLETFELGGDQTSISYEVAGDVGPVYGNFFANEWRTTFDTRDTDTAYLTSYATGLSDNTVYDLAELAVKPWWEFDSQPGTLVYIPESGSLEFGYKINDKDHGLCSGGDDPDCDDVVCKATETARQSLDMHQDGTLISTNGRCRVTYSFGPAPGSPAGSGVPGDVPLPWLNVLGVTVNEVTGAVSIDVSNSGSAAWAARPLEVGVRNSQDLMPYAHVDVYTWDNFELAPGGRTVLEKAEMRAESPYDVCVMVDPNNMVQEYYEGNGERSHTWYCPAQPDLIIRDVEYDASGAGRMRVTVRNVGDAALQNRSVQLQVFLPDGSLASLFGSWPGVTIEPYTAQVFEITGVTAGMRAALQDGYTVIIDPDNTIAESDEENNSWEISTTRLKVWWCDTRLPVYRALRTADGTARLFVRKFIDTVADTVIIDDARTSHSSNNNCWSSGCNDSIFLCEDGYPVFTVLEDETLLVGVTASQEYSTASDPLGSIDRVLTAANDWGAFPAANEEDWNHPADCLYFSMTPNVSGVLNEDPWYSQVCILRLP